MNQRRIGVFGGTFDPIHVGHLIMATELLHALALNQVLFVPAGDPPHKPDIPLTPVAHRLRMLELAIGVRKHFSIDLVDIEREGPSYTKDTLASLRDRFPAERLIFLMGADSLRDLPAWNSPERILELAEIGVGARPGVDVNLELVLDALPTARGRIAVVEIPLIGVSSSELRRRVREQQPISFQVTDGVERYIAEHDLYRTR